MLIIFLDMETTGLDAQKHCAIDVALKIVDPSSGEIKGSYQSLIKQPLHLWEKHDPISIQINGYTWDEVSQGKEISLVGREIVDLFQKLGIVRGKAVFVCQNPAFDRGFFAQVVDVYTQEKLNWPYHWLDLASMYWAKVICKQSKERHAFPEQINLSKNSIAKAYGLKPEAEPHRALNGVNHLIECYKAVIGND